MSRLTPEALNIVTEFAERFGVSTDAVTTLLIAVAYGNGMQAQFNHPELGGMGQWSNGGMTMVGDMFNTGLKATVAGLCAELSRLVAGQNVFEPSPQGSGGRAAWPEDLGVPSSTGAQNSIRYGVFPQKRRLAVDSGGRVEVYDTGDHQISGVSQQQSGDQSLTFTSQFGLVRVADLPRVTGGIAPTPAQAETVAPPVAEIVEQPHVSVPSSQSIPTEPSTDADGTIALIRKLADLKEGGILTEAEFETKKAELLSRL